MLLAAAVGQSPPQMPRIAGESFAGHEVELPEAARGNIAVLIFGFTKASKASTAIGQRDFVPISAVKRDLRFINCRFWRMSRESSVGW